MSDAANMFPNETWQEAAIRMQGGPSTVVIPKDLQYKRFSEVWKEYYKVKEEELPLVVASVPNLLVLMSRRGVVFEQGPGEDISVVSRQPYVCLPCAYDHKRTTIFDPEDGKVRREPPYGQPFVTTCSNNECKTQHHSLSGLATYGPKSITNRQPPPTGLVSAHDGKACGIHNWVCEMCRGEIRLEEELAPTKFVFINGPEDEKCVGCMRNLSNSDCGTRAENSRCMFIPKW